MEDECSALSKLKLNLKSDYIYHTELESWNSSIDCCSWIGVTCENHHVIALDLFGQQIIGGLDNSNSIFDLQHLKKLNLAFNHFSTPTPTALGRLVNLEYLDLQFASFVGEIPTVISSLHQLSTLILSHCNLTGSLPRWIGNLTRLQYLDLSYNRFSGPLPNLSNLRNLRIIDIQNNYLTGALSSSLFALPSLTDIGLSFNQFIGTLPDDQNAYSSILSSIVLGSNMLQGSIPRSLYNLQNLIWLDLSFNNFNGTIKLTDLMRLQNLEYLYLSYNNLSIAAENSSLPLSSHGIYEISLASCNLTAFPNFVNQTELDSLDLSNNHLQGEIPNWIWDISQVNLSYNLLETFESLSQENSKVRSIDLHHNMLTGQLPVFPRQALYIDYSFNRFTSTVPSNIGENLQVLNLRNNKLKGAVPGNISRGCSLLTFDLSHNMLEGEVPITLANCASLTVVNLGNNRIHDRFPCWLKRLPNLRVLVLNSNQFNGPLKCPNTTNWNLWQSLQIIDLSNNYFVGDLLSNFFSDWKAMTKASTKDHPTPEIFTFPVFGFGLAWQRPYTVTIVVSGQELKLEYIWNVFCSIDLSSNMFSGEIPAEIGRLTEVHALNLSHNALTGPIPSTLGSMRELQSLDLSHNCLNGTIPGELAALSFLATVNLSFNQLEGVIPRGTQFQNSPETAFIGNKGLCGFPLHASCRDTGGSSLPPDSPKVAGSSSHASTNIKWDFVTGAEVGFIFGLLILIGPLVLYKRWSQYYFMHLDNVLRNAFGVRRLMKRPARRPI